MRHQTIAYVLAALFLLTASAQAQLPKADDIVIEMQQTLDLDSGQLIKVRQVVTENMSKRINVKPQLSQGLTHAQAQTLDSELFQKLSQILTTSQMNMWCRMSAKIVRSTSRS
jgi:hypothetical protein